MPHPPQRSQPWPTSSRSKHSMGSTARRLLQIPYLPHGQVPAQTVDLFLPSASPSRTTPPRLFIFIHGGAWRSGDNAELHPLAKQLALHDEDEDASNPPIAVALINYRLAPHLAKTPDAAPVFHPAPFDDVHAALRYLLLDRPASWTAVGEEEEYLTHDVVLGGHSVGAWFTAGTMLNPPSSYSPPYPSSSSSSPSPSPPIPAHKPLDPPILRSHIQAYLLLDGIYDIDALLHEYPTYANFVAQAFERPDGDPKRVPGPDDTRGRYAVASVPSWSLGPSYARKQGGGGEGSFERLPRIHLVHSRGDELLSLKQPELARAHLQALLEERLRDSAADGGGGGGGQAHSSEWLHVDYDSVQGHHFGLLTSPGLVSYIRALFR